MAQPIDQDGGVTLRAVFREYLARQVGDGARGAFADRHGIARPDVTNALNGKREVSVGMLQKMADRHGRTASALLMDLARVAFELEAAARLPR